MKIFRGTPIESRLNDPRWATSTHKGWVIVRAENEDRAATLAMLAFIIATSRQPGAEVLTPP